nr:hypothetical protein [uncultured Desulfobacter sp.]
MAQTTSELEAAGIRPLTDPERDRLAECETVIRKGLGTFLEVGKALAEIHDAMLYRETHKEFKRYCREVWDLGQSRAYQQMDGYRAVKLLEDKSSTIVELLSAEKEDENLCDVMNLDPDTLEPHEFILPINEAQARKLTSLSPDDQIKAWSIVLKRLNEGKKLTASLVGKAAKEIKGDTQKRKIKEAQRELEITALVSKIFKTQWQVMVDIISEEQDNGWKNSSKKEVVKWLKNLVKMVETED